HDGIVYLPLGIDLPQLVNDANLLTLGSNDRRFNLRKVVIQDLTSKADSLATIEPDLIRVNSFQEGSEQFNKLLLFCQSPLPPMRTESSPGHLLVIENSIQRHGH